MNKCMQNIEKLYLKYICFYFGLIVNIRFNVKTNTYRIIKSKLFYLMTTDEK